MAPRASSRRVVARGHPRLGEQHADHERQDERRQRSCRVAGVALTAQRTTPGASRAPTPAASNGAWESTRRRSARSNRSLGRCTGAAPGEARDGAREVGGLEHVRAPRAPPGPRPAWRDAARHRSSDRRIPPHRRPAADRPRPPPGRRPPADRERGPAFRTRARCKPRADRRIARDRPAHDLERRPALGARPGDHADVRQSAVDAARSRRTGERGCASRPGPTSPPRLTRTRRTPTGASGEAGCSRPSARATAEARPSAAIVIAAGMRMVASLAPRRASTSPRTSGRRRRLVDAAARRTINPGSKRAPARIACSSSQASSTRRVIARPARPRRSGLRSTRPRPGHSHAGERPRRGRAARRRGQIDRAARRAPGLSVSPHSLSRGKSRDRQSRRARRRARATMPAIVPGRTRRRR